MKQKIIIICTMFVLMFGICVNLDSVIVYAAGKTITVQKNTEKTAQLIDKQLKKGMEVQLKVKGNKTASKKLIQKVRKKVGEVNGCDVNFQYSVAGKSGKYYIYFVSGENAKLYKYSVQFVKKLYKNTRNTVKRKNKAELYDAKVYPDIRERNLHTIYDNLVLYALYCADIATKDAWKEKEDYEWRNKENPRVSGYDLPTTQTQLFNEIRYATYRVPEGIYSNFMYVVKESRELEDDEGSSYELRTYAEFIEYVSANKGLDKLLKEFDIPQVSTQNKIIAEKANFSQLSDAMKVYAVAVSNCFEGYARGGCGIVYTKMKTTSTEGSKGMKYLLTGKARGVCHHFALYECLLWKQLGITGYYNSNVSINHAWSVVKVKNSKGKTLWIPFDYGIGPTMGGNTEKKRYKLYLKGINGAPSYKNWKNSDFN